VDNTVLFIVHDSRSPAVSAQFHGVLDMDWILTIAFTTGLQLASTNAGHFADRETCEAFSTGFIKPYIMERKPKHIGVMFRCIDGSKLTWMKT